MCVQHAYNVYIYIIIRIPMHVLYQTLGNMNTTYNNELLIMNSDCWLFRGGKKTTGSKIKMLKRNICCVFLYSVLWFTVRRKMSMCGKACLKKIWLPCSHLDIKLWNSLEVVLWILQHAAHWSFANRNRAYTYIPWWFYYEILIEKKISCEMMDCRYTTYKLLYYSIDI